MSNVNKLNFKAKLSKDQITADTMSKLSGAKGVLSAFTAYAENHAIDVSAISAGVMLKKHKDPIKTAITANLQAMMGSSIAGSIADKVLHAEYQNIIANDIKTIGAKLERQMNLYDEAYMTNSYNPFQLATVPHVYLETIQMNVRFLMPVKEYESEQLPPRRFAIRQIVIGGEKYDFPHCLKNADVMRKLTSAGSKPLDITVAKADLGKTNLFDHTNGVGVKGTDTLLPQADIVKINYTDKLRASKELDVKISSTSPDVHNYTRGRLTKSVDDKEIYIAGEVDFASGDIKMLSTDNIESVTFRVYMSGAYNRNVASVDVKTEPIHQMIKNRLNMIFDYDSGAIKNFLSLENLDGVLEGQSIIFDTVNAVKDQLGFDVMNSTLADLREAHEKLGALMNDKNDGYAKEIHYTQPGVESGFRPNNEEDWDTKSLARRMKLAHTSIDKKFNSKTGIQCNWYASPAQVARFIDSTPIISKETNYGGVTTDYSIFGLQVGGRLVKVVETERAVDADGFRCVPYSNMESQPTFEFQQAQHALYSDGSYRSATNPHMPAIAYFDYFDCNKILAIMAEIEVVEGAPPVTR